MHVLTYLLRKYPDKSWHWWYLAINPTLTIEDILSYPDNFYDFYHIVRNKHFANKMIKQWFEHKNAKSMTFTYNGMKYDLPFNYTTISQYVTMDIIEKNPMTPWVWSAVSYNANLTMEFVLKNTYYSWDWEAISRNPNITMENIEQNLYNPWQWDCISENPNLTMEMIEKYPDRPWDWGNISSNSNITMEIIEQNPDKPWAWSRISSNPNLTMNMIEKYPHQRWDWWNISSNPNITMDDINNNPDKRWYLRNICNNQNITIEFIEKNINNINFGYLSTNNFTFENIRIKKNESYMLLEKECSFHKMMNLYITNQYM